MQAASRLGAEQSAKLCVQYLAPIIKNRQYNFLPLGENLFVGADARPNEVTYSEDWLRPDYVPPPAATRRRRRRRRRAAPPPTRRRCPPSAAARPVADRTGRPACPGSWCRPEGDHDPAAPAVARWLRSAGARWPRPACPAAAGGA